MRQEGCVKKHANPYVDCKVGVVYQIALKCGKVYVGQSGRCINDHMNEHDLFIKNNTNAHLPANCLTCTSGDCEALVKEVKVLCRSGGTKPREILQAYHLKKK